MRSEGYADSGHVVVVKEDVIGSHARYAEDVAELEKRSSYTPRRAREQRAYRLVVSGSVAGLVGIVTLVLAVAGVVSGAIPAIALIVAALCAYAFSRTVRGQ